MIRALIVDDESLARRALRRLLRTHADIDIVGEAADGDAALLEAGKLKPAQVFLDIQMPAMNGLELAAELVRQHRLAIIFVTAHDNYALQAFEIHATDYLLKPFTAERLDTALQRARERIHAAADVGAVERLIAEMRKQATQPRYLDRIPAAQSGRIRLIPVASVQRIDAMGNYAKLHTSEASFEIRETLQSLSEKLDPACFVRVHRSTIVNLDFVREVKTWFRGGHLIVMKDGSQVRLSRYQTEAVQRLTGKAH